MKFELKQQIAKNKKVQTSVWKCIHNGYNRIAKIYHNYDFNELNALRMLQGTKCIAELLDWFFYEGCITLIFPEYLPIELYYDEVEDEDGNVEIDSQLMIDYGDDVTMFDDDMVRDMMSALDMCHRHGIIHCDLKPENLMYDPVSNTVMIIDFSNCEFYDPIAWAPSFSCTKGFEVPLQEYSYFTFDVFQMSHPEILQEIEVKEPHLRPRADQAMDMEFINTNYIKVAITPNLKISLFENTPYSSFEMHNYDGCHSILSERMIKEHSYYHHHMLSKRRNVDFRNAFPMELRKRMLRWILIRIQKVNYPISLFFNTVMIFDQYCLRYGLYSTEEHIIKKILSCIVLSLSFGDKESLLQLMDYCDHIVDAPIIFQYILSLPVLRNYDSVVLIYKPNIQQSVSNYIHVLCNNYYNSKLINSV